MPDPIPTAEARKLLTREYKSATDRNARYVPPDDLSNLRALAEDALNKREQLARAEGLCEAQDKAIGAQTERIHELEQQRAECPWCSANEKPTLARYKEQQLAGAKERIGELERLKVQSLNALVALREWHKTEYQSSMVRDRQADDAINAVLLDGKNLATQAMQDGGTKP